MENMTFEVDNDGIALITWDMPGRSMNVLSQGSMADFSECVERVCSDDNIKGAVVTSGKDSFMAGADLTMLEGSGSGDAMPKSKEERAKFLYENNLKFNMQLRKLETCGKPWAAAIPGTALGGGLEVCLACHYRVAADNPKAQIGLPEAKVGLLPGGGGTQRLPRMIGPMAALPLILEGKTLDPQKAQQQGIVDKVVPAGEEVAEAKRWIKEEGKSKATKPWDVKGFKVPGGGPHSKDGSNIFTAGNAMLLGRTHDNYPAQKYIMQAVYEGLQVPMDAALRIESRYFTKLLLDPTSRNMIRTLFLSMQELNKGARRPKDIEPTDVKKLGILGAGMMGAGIAYVSARAGIETVLLDTELANAEKGKAYSENLLKKGIQRGKTTQEKADKTLALITPTTDYNDLKGCDLIIEAVFEDRNIKADVTKKAEAQLAEDAIFGSNTSTLPITGLAEASERPAQFIGIHFFSPVDKMPLVELILGKKTEDRAIAVAIDYVKKIRKTPIVVNDSRGFYTSRVFGTYVGEGQLMLAEGVKPALIENAGKSTGMPMPPLALNDEVSLELGYHVRQQMKKDLGDAFQETPADKLIEKMVVELGRKGKKNGKGFYDYPEGGQKQLWPGLADLYPAKDQQPTVDELKKRFLYIQALETARCFEEGVLTDVRDADVGAILGWGFAPYTGGPLSLIDTVGTKQFVAECQELAKKHGKRFEPNALLKEMAENDEKFYDRFNPKKKAEAEQREPAGATA